MKRFKRIVGIMMAAGMLLMLPTAAAQAAPFSLEIDNAVMDLGGLTGVRGIDSRLTPPDPPATLDGEVTDGNVSIPKEGFYFPTKTAEVSPPITADIDMEANEPITGTYDAGTGKLVLDASLKATVKVLTSTCVISPIELTLTTENARPYFGERFASGLTSPGAIAAPWAGLPPVTGGGSCGMVAGLVAGPGGIWMSQDIVDPKTCDTDPGDPRCSEIDAPTVKPRIISGPDSVTKETSANFSFAKGATETQPVTGFQCKLDGGEFEACDSGSKSYTGLALGDHTFTVKSTNGEGAGPEETKAWTVTDDPTPPGEPKFGALSVKPKNKAVKRGKKVTLTAKIPNIGNAAASGVKICVKAPAKLVKVKKCQTVGSLAAGKTASAKFKVTVKKKAKKGKKATLKFIASGSGLASKTATAKVKVK